MPVILVLRRCDLRRRGRRAERDLGLDLIEARLHRVDIGGDFTVRGRRRSMSPLILFRLPMRPAATLAETRMGHRACGEERDAAEEGGAFLAANLVKREPHRQRDHRVADVEQDVGDDGHGSPNLNCT